MRKLLISNFEPCQIALLAPETLAPESIVFITGLPSIRLFVYLSVHNSEMVAPFPSCTLTCMAFTFLWQFLHLYADVGCRQLAVSRYRYNQGGYYKDLFMNPDVRTFLINEK